MDDQRVDYSNPKRPTQRNQSNNYRHDDVENTSGTN